MNATLLSTVLLLPLLTGCGRNANDEAAEPPSVQAEIARVQAVDLTSTFEAGGVVRARQTAPIASRILAPVVAVHVRAGDRVRRGAPLVTLEGREIAANHARAAASLAASVEAVGAAEGAVRSAEAAVALARVTHDRVRTLHEKRSATTQELDQAVAALSAAEGQLHSARANLASAAAARQAAQAASDAAAVAVSYATLTAPFDGVVSERKVDAGAMATPGVPLLTIEDPAALRLEVTIDEARAGTIATGQPAEVSIGGGPADGAWAAAKIGEIERIDPASHSLLVKLDLPSGTAVRSGAFGRARFTGEARRTLVIPSSASVQRGQLTFAFVIDADNRARLRPISPGSTVAGNLEVLAGLAAGDRVVLAPPAALRDGVRITEVRR